MLRTLQTWRVPIGIGLKVMLFTKSFRMSGLALGLLLALTMQVKGQEAEVIKPWSALPEAEFFFDTAYAVVKCSPQSEPVIVMEAFNEGGNVTSISFELIIGDKDRNQATVIIPRFDIAPSKFLRHECGNSDTKFLEISAPEGIDAQSMFIYQIKYIK